MKYLTKEWCRMCKRMNLGDCLEVLESADTFDEGLFQKLYKEKEEEFTIRQKSVCEGNPHIEVLIENYGNPFDMERCRAIFRQIQEESQKSNLKIVPAEIYEQIADPRLFALGYSTKAIIEQLEAVGEINEKLVHETLRACSNAEKSQSIPETLSNRFHFHDCEVMSYEEGDDFTVHLDPCGGFTDDNRIIFRDAEIVEYEGDLTGSTLLYEELYREGEVYEAHILYWNGRNRDLIIRCKDIEVDRK